MWQVFLDGCSVLSENWFVALGAMGVTCLACCLVFFLLRGTRAENIPRQSLWLLAFFFAVSVILRLAFLDELYVPPYFDSVEHFSLIKKLTTALESSNLLATIPALTPNYYHLGFHFLAALLTLGLRADPINVILILGQIILAAIPIPIYFLIRHETKSDSAAFFGILLAGFGWYMPGFAVNWGKYPALAGLLAFELVLNAAYFSSGQKTKRTHFLAIGFLVLSIFIAILFHSRTLVTIIIAFVSWFIAGKLSGFTKKIQALLLGVLLTGILLFGFLVWQEPLLNLALDPYLEDRLWLTLAVAILSPFAFLKFPKGSYFNLLVILFTLSASFIPIGIWLPGYENQTLLDRPFVEMFLYLPLSLLGGLGLAGLLQTVNDIKAFHEKIRPHARILTAIILLGSAILIPLRDYNFYPSDCCNFMGYDDTIAFDWLNRNTPLEALILIPSTQLHVLPSGPSTNPVGTDAGIWIPALTGRTTSFAAFDTDFRSENTLEKLCQEQIDYVYVGGTEQIFDAAQLQAKSEWYGAILSLPNVQLYEMTGCVKK